MRGGRVQDLGEALGAESSTDGPQPVSHATDAYGETEREKGRCCLVVVLSSAASVAAGACCGLLLRPSAAAFCCGLVNAGLACLEESSESTATDALALPSFLSLSPPPPLSSLLPLSWPSPRAENRTARRTHTRSGRQRRRPAHPPLFLSSPAPLYCLLGHRQALRPTVLSPAGHRARGHRARRLERPGAVFCPCYAWAARATLPPFHQRHR